MKPFNLQEALAGKKVVDKYERIGYYVGMIDNHLHLHSLRRYTTCEYKCSCLPFYYDCSLK